MSKIKIYELKVSDSEFTELNRLETVNIVGGCDEESESSQEIIQKAMQEAVNRSDLLNNGNPAILKKNSSNLSQ